LTFDAAVLNLLSKFKFRWQGDHFSGIMNASTLVLPHKYPFQFDSAPFTADVLWARE
jgi:hypothetical protein